MGTGAQRVRLARLTASSGGRASTGLARAAVARRTTLRTALGRSMLSTLWTLALAARWWSRRTNLRPLTGATLARRSA